MINAGRSPRLARNANKTTPTAASSDTAAIATASRDEKRRVPLVAYGLRDAACGAPLVQLIGEAGAVPGIKVDKGTKPLPGFPGETITEGLDGLPARLTRDHERGARFAKWRAVIDIGEGIPTEVLFKVAPGTETATLYSVEALPQPGELTSENNRRALLVPPPGRPRRVLLVEGAPGFEHSFLKRALDQDNGHLIRRR